MSKKSDHMIKSCWKYEVLSCRIKGVKGWRNTMCPNAKKNETDGKRPAKKATGIASRCAGSDEPFADLLDEPLPAG